MEAVAAVFPADLLYSFALCAALFLPGVAHMRLRTVTGLSLSDAQQEQKLQDQGRLVSAAR